ncbi:MAG: YbhN family protein [Armatimonadota bacterium]
MKRLKLVLHVGLVIGLVVAATKYLNGGEVWSAIHRFRWELTPVILAGTLLYFGLKAARFAYLVRRVEPVSPTLLVVAYLAGQAYTALPAGAAARSGLLKQAGVPIAGTAPAVLVGSAGDGVALFTCSLLSALWFPAFRGTALWVLGGLVLVCTLLGVEAVRSWLADLAANVADRFNVRERWEHFVEALQQSIAPKPLLVSLGNGFISVGILIVVLHFSVHGVGGDVPELTLLLAVALPSMLARLSAVPAGIGVTEAGMVAILDGAPGITLPTAAAAVTIFRVGTIVFEIALGVAIYFLLWRPLCRRELHQNRARAT